MGCGHEQQLKWEAVKYDTEFRDKEKVDSQQRGRPCWVSCVVCQKAHEDSPQVRRHIIERGHWQSQNPNPQPGVVSYHWNALLPPWVRWQDLVDEWTRANELKKLGNIEPLKIFICESLGEPWEDRADQQTMTVRMNLLRSRMRQYDGADPWDGEAKHPRLGHRQRFIGADVQSDVIYWRARQFGRGGESRGVAFGRVFTFDELEQVRRDLQVPSHYLFVDSGFRTQEVYRACARWGWAACKGEDKEWFSKATAKGSIRNVFNQSRAVPHSETGAAYSNEIPLFIWSNPSVKDMLELYITGEAGEWTVERLSGTNAEEYLLQVIGEERRKIVNNKTGAAEYVWHKIHDDHWRDCELMILVAAMASGVLASGDNPQE
jgi:phage terminase large subunit GpA-like protein